MKSLRILLVICLSLSVPTTALAAVVGKAQCEHRHMADTIVSVDHVQNVGTSMQHGDHSQHSAHDGAFGADHSSQCPHCNSGQCASGSVSALVALSDNTLSEKSAAQLIASPISHTAAAHSNSLFRPPA